MQGRQKAKIKNIEQYDFDHLSKTTGTFRERKRYLAFAHIQERNTFVDTAKMVRTNLRTLMKWVQKFREKGIEGLKDNYG